MKNETQSIQRYFDVVIFVATDGEKEAILSHTKLIDSYVWKIEHDKNGEILYTLLLETVDHKILRIALQALPVMGAESCVYYVSRFLKDFSCSLVCMVGICAGEGKDTCKGDIVIPGKVASISNGKQAGDNFRPANRFHSIDEELRKELSSFVALHRTNTQRKLIERWDRVFSGDKRKSLLTKKKNEDWPKLHFEEKLVMAQVFHVRAYSGAFKDLENFSSREVIALEMESAALAFTVEKIASQNAQNTRWLIIKGVQDYADGKKDHKYREFCSWASFSVLTSFLKEKLQNLWAHKINLLSCTTDIEHLECHDLEESYRIGDYDRAIEIGRKVHKNNPNNAAIWYTYIRALCRVRKYEEVREVIDIADYCIAEFDKVNKSITFDVHSSYLLGKADFYRRLRKFEDSRMYIDEILENGTKNNNVATALYIKGCIAMKLFEDQPNEAYFLREAEKYLQDAFDMNPSGYWAGTLLLIAKYCGGDYGISHDGGKETIDKVKNVILENIKNTPRRPAPRIYFIKLNALLVAAKIQTFSELQEVIDKDIVECSSQIFLPDDFFVDLEDDCRILFYKPEQRHLRDELLSKIYCWASKIRKR